MTNSENRLPTQAQQGLEAAKSMTQLTDFPLKSPSLQHAWLWANEAFHHDILTNNGKGTAAPADYVACYQAGALEGDCDDSQSLGFQHGLWMAEFLAGLVQEFASTNEEH